MAASRPERRVLFASLRPHPWRLLLVALLIASPFSLAACADDVGNRPLGCASSPTPCLQGTAVVKLETSRGPVEISLDGKAAPLTAGNFVDLVNRGAYNNTVFHRVVRDPVPFVVQGGDPSSADPKVPASQYGTGSFVDPASGEARLIPLEIGLQGEAEPRYGAELTAPSISRQLRLSHQRRVLTSHPQAPVTTEAQGQQHVIDNGQVRQHLYLRQRQRQRPPTRQPLPAYKLRPHRPRRRAPRPRWPTSWRWARGSRR